MNSLEETFVIRYSEIGLKGPKARRKMESKLRRNIIEMASRLGQNPEVTIGNGRLFLRGHTERNAIVATLSHTMGVKSFSLALHMKSANLPEIVEVAEAIFSPTVAGKKFAVRSRHAGGHSFDSRDVNSAVGDRLFKYSSGVDLDHPEVAVEIEVRNDQTYFILDNYKGPGGLPIGTEGRLTALVSGGIDSPVAAWMMLKRGCPVDFVFVTISHPFDTIEFLNSVEPLIRGWIAGYSPRINIVDGKPIVDALLLRGKVAYPNVTYKRILYLVAQEIAFQTGSNGIVTGESIGQVSSQTPENLRAIESGIDLPVFRPLIGFDKDDITHRSREIGTFPRESLGEFCELFATNIVLNATSDLIDRDMENIHFLNDLVAQRVVISATDVADFRNDLLRAVASGHNADKGEVVVVDLRKKESYEEWHHPGAVNVTLPNLISFLEGVDKNKTLMFYCQKGLQSSYAASVARKKGFNAIFTTTERLRNTIPQ
ncbi:MAG: THUMP domain-containing protein [Thermoplasmataceae archaeon]